MFNIKRRLDMSIWILVADSYQAHLYSVPSVIALSNYGEANSLDGEHNHPELEPFESFIHVESKEMDSEIASDKFGNNRHSGDNSSSGGSFIDENSPKDHEKQVFAKQVSDFLNNKKIDDKYNDLIIAAPSKFIGILKDDLSADVLRCIIKEIDKDYTNDINQPRVLANNLSQHF
jgi:protein required for attachment to host cells